MTDGFTFGALPQIDAGAGARQATAGRLHAGLRACRLPRPGQRQPVRLLDIGARSPTTLYGIHGANMSTLPARHSWRAAERYCSLVTRSQPGGTRSRRLTSTRNQQRPDHRAGLLDPTPANVLCASLSMSSTPPYQNTLFCYPVTPDTGALSHAGMPITNDPARSSTASRACMPRRRGTSPATCGRSGRPPRAGARPSTTIRAVAGNLVTLAAGTTGLLPVPAGLTAWPTPRRCC